MVVGLRNWGGGLERRYRERVKRRGEGEVNV